LKFIVVVLNLFKFGGLPKGTECREMRLLKERALSPGGLLAETGNGQIASSPKIPNYQYPGE